MAPTIGIDLGTTYSAAALVRTGHPVILPNAEGHTLTPSVVLLQDANEVLVGTDAKNSAAETPDDCAQFAKRGMGDPNWRFFDSRGAQHTPEQLSAMILRKVASDAGLELGETVTDLVITVPAYFGDAQRQATKDAAQIADLNVVRLINEPTAAAIAYGVEYSENGTYLVYDLGGGTFDVTILRVTGTDFHVVGTDGDRNLGGYDFDNALCEYVARRVVENGGPDVSEDPALLASLREKCELAKRKLSTLNQTKIPVGIGGGRAMSIEVTRAEFESITENLLQRTELITEAVLNAAGLTWAQIDRLLLVGGSTRMPMVRGLVERMSGKAPEIGINPDEVVALGAAIVADQVVSSKTGAQPELHKVVSIKDVTSQGLGTTVIDETTNRPYNSIMIQPNTKIPIKMEHTYYTMVPNQRRLLMDITEGNEEDPEFVTKLCEKEIPLPPGLPDRAPLLHIMSFDIDGLVHLEVVDETNGKSLGEVELDRPSNLGEHQVEEMRVAMRRVEVG